MHDPVTFYVKKSAKEALDTEAHERGETKTDLVIETLDLALKDPTDEPVERDIATVHGRIDPEKLRRYERKAAKCGLTLHAWMRRATERRFGG